MGSLSMASISPKRLEGKVAVITGAAGGIGESIARLFHKHGAKVVIADIQDDLGEKLSQELGESASFVHCDISKESDAENAVNTAVSLFGKLDIMVNNAGIVGPNTVKIVESEKSHFERVINTNLIGAFLGTKHAAKVMIPNRAGVIVCTGSVATTIGGAAPYAYTISKHGLMGLVKNAAVELGEHGIRVNCVSPFTTTTQILRDFMKTDDEGCHKIFSDLKVALLSPNDVAEATLFAASDESKFMNGHNLVIDGGYTIENRAFNVFGHSV